MALRKHTEASRDMSSIQKEDSLEEIVEKVMYKNITSLENTRKMLDLQVLEHCVRLLLSQKSIYLFGVGASLLVAKDLYLKFLRVDKQCYLCDDLHAQYVLAQNIHKDGVAVMISYSGMTKEMVYCAEKIKQAKAPLILISRLEDSPLARLADYHLCVASSEYLIRSGAMSSRITQLSIVDILYTAYINTNLEYYVKKIQENSLHKEKAD